MRAVRSPRRHGRSALGLGAAIAALLTGMTAGLWPPGAGDASAIAVAGPNDSWGKAIEVPGLETLNKGGDAEVNSVSCARPGICAAGGFYRDADRHWQGFVAVEKNGRWRPAIEVPGLATLNKGGNAEVNSVSCTSRGGCAAGGFYRDGEGHRQGFVAMERRGRWRRAIEVPGLATLNTGGDVGVTSVSCVSGGGCAAGGFYRDADRHRQGFVVVEKNGWWRRAIEVPGLATLNTGGNAGVASVSCASAGSCAAGGHYRDHGRQGFVVVEKNGRWRGALEVPGLGNLNKGGDAEVFSVSCGAAGSCAAAGATPRRTMTMTSSRSWPSSGTVSGPGDRRARPQSAVQRIRPVPGRLRRLGVVRLGGQLRGRRGLRTAVQRGVRGQREQWCLAPGGHYARPVDPDRRRLLGVVRLGG